MFSKNNRSLCLSEFSHLRTFPTVAVQSNVKVANSVTPAPKKVRIHNHAANAAARLILGEKKRDVATQLLKLHSY